MCMWIRAARVRLWAVKRVYKVYVNLRFARANVCDCGQSFLKGGCVGMVDRVHPMRAHRVRGLSKGESGAGTAPLGSVFMRPLCRPDLMIVL